MAEINMRSPSHQAVVLLTAVCILLASEVASQVPLGHIFEHVAYEDILNSNVLKIQSDIVHSFNGNVSFRRDHYTVYSSDTAKTVIFMWASEQETHAMRSCLYQELKRIGKMRINKASLEQRVPTFTFCNRSVISKVGLYETIGKRILSLSFYVNDTMNHGRFLAAPPAFHQFIDNNFAATVTSKMTVRLQNDGDVDSRVHTFVCSSIEFTRGRTGKLWQRFFSVIKNSSEVIYKASRNDSVSAGLDFDVLALNASRIGLLNNSNVELLSLLDLIVACAKRDPFGLNNATNEVMLMDTTGERSITTKAVLRDNKLRLHVNVFIPVISDHSFGSYICQTYCILQTKNYDRITGCLQEKHFSIVLDDWRTENMCYRRYSHRCLNSIIGITEKYDGELKEVRSAKEYAEYMAAKYYNILIATIVTPIIIVVICVVYKSIREEFKIRRYAKLFKNMLTTAQVMENSDNRTIKYDVYLSYSSKDRPWVEFTLLPFMEDKGFRVCFDERDFPLGCTLPGTIAKSVFESRKAIAVLSPDYLKSGRCINFEYALMLTKIINREASSSSVLVIKYRDCQLPHEMKSIKCIDYAKACNEKRSVLMNVLCYVFPFFQKPDQTLFYDDLSLWLGEPRVL